MNGAEVAVKPISQTDIDVQNTAQVYQMPKDAAQKLLVEFVASGGLVVAADGEVEKMSIRDFAEKIGWAERTMYNWMDNDPEWDQKVYEAMSKVYGAKRVARVLRAVFVEAAKGKKDQAELFLRHFWPDYKNPKTVQENEFSFTSLVKATKDRQVIDVTDSNQALPAGSSPAPTDSQN